MSLMPGCATKGRKAQTATARLSEEVIRMANIVSAIRKISTPDYLTSILKPVVERDYQTELKKETKKSIDKIGG